MTRPQKAVNDFYHNLGQEMKVMDAASGKALNMKPTEELAFADGHLYAYSYIYNKVSAEITSSVKTQFVTRIEDEKVVAAMDNQKEITMTMWMKADENRTIFQALSPENREYERMPNQPYKVIDQPVLPSWLARRVRHGIILSSAYMNQVLIQNRAILHR